MLNCNASCVFAFVLLQFAADRGGSISTIEMEPQRNKSWIC